jgi:ubiquinone/menaquinone biosynthesis C-methylase UbiE
MSEDLAINPSDSWDEFYAQPETEIQHQIDQSVCGCGYYGSSWMNAGEATDLAGIMNLDASRHLLDIGSGAGWPALYQAEKTGCRITLTDISVEGLRAADRKATADGLGHRCHTVHTSAERLPFRSASFDAIGHADVLCCLEGKLDALNECQRVIRDRGIMAFSVIHMRPGATKGETEAAATAGPSLIAAHADYPEMLMQTGWQIENCVDITEGYASILDRLLEEYEQHAISICAQHNEEHYAELLQKCVSKQQVVSDSSVKRSLFTVTPRNRCDASAQ